MQGKTHFVVGTALALGILRPEGMPAVIVGTGAAALGSVISDIDSGHSGAGQDAAKVLAGSAIIAILTVAADLVWNTGILDALRERLQMSGALMAGLAFVLILLAGILLPHRSFMHSVLCGALLSACLWKVLPEGWAYFAIGFGSHLLLDLTNQRGEKLFYPYRKNYSLGWFKSNGLVNRILLAAGSAALAIILYHLVLPFLQGAAAEAGSAAQAASHTAAGWFEGILQKIGEWWNGLFRR